MTVEKHYTTPELSTLLSVSQKTLRRAALKGELTPVRIGAILIWPESVVEAWLARNRVDNARVVPLHLASTTRRSA